MNLYIQIKDGVPINHPAYESNLLQFYEAIPSDWVPFVRVETPKELEQQVGVYQKTQNTYITTDNGATWTETWSIVDKSADEKASLINFIKNNQPYPSWVFDQSVCEWLPPKSKPKDGAWDWDETNQSWVDVMPPEMKLSSVSFL